MDIEIKDAIEELVGILKIYAPEDCVAFELFVNSEGSEAKFRHRNPKELKENGITMKNLKGDWVK